MPVPAQSRVNRHQGNGVTDTYAYSFRILNKLDLGVEVDGVTLTVDIDYTVTGVGEANGGSVDFTNPPANLAKITLYSNAASERTRFDYVRNGPFKEETVDGDFDQLTILIQQLDERFGRGIYIPITDATGVNVELPPETARAGNLLQFDALGNVSVAAPADLDLTTVSAFISTLLDDLNAATARTTLGAAASDNPTFTGQASFSGSAYFGAGGTLTFEGVTDDAFETILSPGEPTADRTLTLPDQSGTLAITPRGYIDGLRMSTAGSSTTMTIAAGVATDSTNTYLMALAASISKTTAAWAVGNAQGGLDTGVVANNTWYHFHLITRADTGVVDALFSLSASAPTLPANYTQSRRIGSGRTNGSGQWLGFTQDGDYFRWSASILDVNATNPGTAAVLRTLSVPPGVNVIALFNGGSRNTAAGVDAPALFSDPAANDEAPSFTAAPLTSVPNAINISGGVVSSYAQHQIRTNTSAQVRSRLMASDGSTSLNMATLGWIDSRGRNA